MSADKALVISQPASVLAGPREMDELLVEAFLAEQDISRGSKATYRRQLKQFLAWLGATGRLERLYSKDFDISDIVAYREWLLDVEAMSAYSVNGYLTAVRRLFEWMEGRKIYPNVARDVKGAKKPKGFRKDTLTPEQLRQALNTIDRGNLEGLRDYALFLLMAKTGLRVVEVHRARVGDLRQEAGAALLWVQGKGRDEKDDFVLVLPEALSAIRAYHAARGPIMSDDEPLFASHSNRTAGQPLATRTISYIVKEALRAIGLDDKRLTAHSLRHTAISLSIKGGASLVQAQEMARHADPRTTMTYLHNLQRVEQAAERYIQF